MKYWKVTCSNQFAGCDETFYFEAKNKAEAEYIGIEFLEDEYSFYNPDERFIDMDNKEEVEEYYDNLMYWVKEISKEEYYEATADYL